MQQSQKAAAEAEAQSHGGLRLVEQGGVVELQLLQRVPQIVVFCAVRGIKAAVHHAGHLLVTRQGRRAGVVPVGHRVAHLGIPDVLDAGGDITHHTRRQLVAGDKLAGSEIAHLHHVLLGPRGHQADGGAPLHRALHNAAENDHALVGVVDGVENQRLKGSLGITRGGRNLLHDGLQHRLHVLAGLGGNPGRVAGVQADHVLDLSRHVVRLGAGQIHLVDHGKYVQIVVQGQVHVGQSLGLDALGGVHYQDRAVAGRQASGHLVVKVNVSRSVDQVENILAAVLGLVNGAHGLRFDGDAALPLQVHIVENLFLHLPAGQKAGFLNNPVRQGGFAVVDMGDDTKVANFALVND